MAGKTQGHRTSLVCVIGLSLASAGGREQLATRLLFGLGLLLGLAVGPGINAYASADPAALWQAAGATGAFVATLRAVGYATRRDLSPSARPLFWALIGLIVFGIVALSVSIPHANLIYAIAGLVIFGGFTLFDTSNGSGALASRARSRSRRASSSTSSTCSCSGLSSSAASATSRQSAHESLPMAPGQRS
jgi:FtsH-binding integral membrane protein